MPRKHSRKAELIAGDLTDPHGLGRLLRSYLDSLRVRNYAQGTIQKRRVQLNDFIDWAQERSWSRSHEITRPILERYQRHLFHATDKRGKPLTFRNQYSRLSSLRTWFQWLARANHLLHNPASELELPKLGHPLPQHVLSEREAEEILNQVDVSQWLGIRDRAMLETFYSTGIRRMELITLQVYDVDRERGVLRVRQGKGRKDRVVPIGGRALAWTQKYGEEVRPKLVRNEQEQTLYLTKLGEGFSASSLSLLVSQYVSQAATGKTGSCHLFRHTMATLMHENGADIRFLQAMLGHAKLDTTQIYTQVSIRKLKEIHDATHPAEQEGRSKGHAHDNAGDQPQNDTDPGSGGAPDEPPGND